MPEEWRPVAGYEGLYEVSDLGRIRSVKNEKTKHRGLVLSQAHNRGRYRQVTLKKGGHGRTLMVHQVVAHAFLGEQKPGLEVRHLNGDKEDNGVANLAYGTKSENMKDMVRHGTHRFGKSHCIHGHEFTPDNIYLTKAGYRVCKKCQNSANKRCYEARKARS